MLTWMSGCVNGHMVLGLVGFICELLRHEVVGISQNGTMTC